MPLGVRLQVYVDLLNQSLSHYGCPALCRYNWLFDQDPLVTLRASFERRIGEACISTQYPSQSPFEAGSLDPLSRFGATSRVIFAFDHAVPDEDDF